MLPEYDETEAGKKIENKKTKKKLYKANKWAAGLLTSSLHAQEQEEAAKRDKQALYKKEKKPKNWENKKHTARDLSLFP